MIIGIPKEIKNNENRVALTPSGVFQLVKNGHVVLIENSTGEGSGISNDKYIAAGAEIIDDKAKLFKSAEMIMKVKEPLECEYDLFKENQILFAYLHLAPNRELTQSLADRKIIGIAYETIEMPNGSLPLLTPMSEVAGRMSVQIGASLLQKYYGGRGVLLGGVPGVAPANVVIVGGGIVGINAAKIALGFGANVTILDINADRLRYLDDIFWSKTIQTMTCTEYNLAKVCEQADLLVGAVLVAGAVTPKIVTEAMVKTMRKGSVIVDVAIDQGGCVETMDHSTTHDHPTFVKHGVIHYSVPNIPGAVPYTSTYALESASLPYALKIAGNKLASDIPLRKGVNLYSGHVTNKAVAEGTGLEYTPLETLI